MIIRLHITILFLFLYACDKDNNEGTAKKNNNIRNAVLKTITEHIIQNIITNIEVRNRVTKEIGHIRNY